MDYETRNTDKENMNHYGQCLCGMVEERDETPAERATRMQAYADKVLGEYAEKLRNGTYSY